VPADFPVDPDPAVLAAEIRCLAER
jgi:hypothetical protein